MKKISELITYKTVTRKGKTVDFEFKYNPNAEKFNLRLLAKLIDFLFYYGLAFIAVTFLKLNNTPLFSSIILLFIVNPILEHVTGKSLGKFCIGFEVVDDSCQKPSLLRSYSRNILQLFNVFIYMLTSGTVWGESFYLHNKKTTTYTIWSREKTAIIKMMNS